MDFHITINDIKQCNTKVSPENEGACPNRRSEYPSLRLYSFFYDLALVYKTRLTFVNFFTSQLLYLHMSKLEIDLMIPWTRAGEKGVAICKGENWLPVQQIVEHNQHVFF